MISAERLRELLHYDPSTGAFTWRVRRGRSGKGARAGSPRNTLGYPSIQIDRKLYQAHRLAWLYVYGTWPERWIDHIDCNTSNNAIANLRSATPSQNGGNSRTSRRNSSGLKGVDFEARSGRWRSKICVNRRIYRLGLFDTAEAAHAAYLAAAYEHFGEFARAA